MHEPLKNRTYLGKNCFQILGVLILSRPKAVTDMKKQPVLVSDVAIKNVELKHMLVNILKMKHMCHKEVVVHKLTRMVGSV